MENGDGTRFQQGSIDSKGFCAAVAGLEAQNGQVAVTPPLAPAGVDAAQKRFRASGAGPMSGARMAAWLRRFKK